MKIREIDVTPEIAENWLEKNSLLQRPVKRAVESYAKDMEEDRWEKDNPTPITFWEDGTLVDGQHRLRAVIKSGKTIRFCVAVVPVGVSVFDCQVSRTVSDLSKMSGGGPIRNAVSAAISLSINKNSNIKTSKTKIIEEYNKNNFLWNRAYEIIVKGAKGPIGRKSYCVLATFYALQYGISESSLERFFTVVNSGFAENKGESAAILLRNVLLEEKVRSPCGTRKTSPWVMEGLIEEYIYLFLNKTERKIKVKNPTWRYSKCLEE